MNWIVGFWQWIASLFSGRQADAAEVTAIQAMAINACGFLPQFDTVIALLATGSPALATVEQIAGAVCDRVKAMQPVQTESLFGSPTVQAGNVNGVPIHGVFIK